MIFVEGVVVINPPIEASAVSSRPLVYPMYGVAHFWSLIMATLMTTLSNLDRIIF